MASRKKIQKYEIAFLTRGRKEKEVTADQNNDEQKIVTKRSDRCRLIVLWGGGRIKLWEMEIFYLILEVSNLLDMMSRDEKRPPPAERRASRICMEATNLPPTLVTSPRIHCWGSREQVNGINYRRLIKKSVDEIRPLGIKRNGYINSVFIEKRQ